MLNEKDETLKSEGGVLRDCFPIPFSRTSKSLKKSSGNSRFYILLSKLITKNMDQMLMINCTLVCTIVHMYVFVCMFVGFFTRSLCMSLFPNIAI